MEQSTFETSFSLTSTIFASFVWNILIKRKVFHRLLMFEKLHSSALVLKLRIIIKTNVDISSAFFSGRGSWHMLSEESRILRDNGPGVIRLFSTQAVFAKGNFGCEAARPIFRFSTRGKLDRIYFSGTHHPSGRTFRIHVYTLLFLP